jgi:flagellar biosynthesis regulator FlaF
MPLSGLVIQCSTLLSRFIVYWPCNQQLPISSSMYWIPWRYLLFSTNIKCCTTRSLPYILAVQVSLILWTLIKEDALVFTKWLQYRTSAKLISLNLNVLKHWGSKQTIKLQQADFGGLFYNSVNISDQIMLNDKKKDKWWTVRLWKHLVIS